MFKYISILVLIAATTTVLFFDRYSQPERDHRIMQPLLSDLRGIDKIELQTADEQISLTAQAGKWIIVADGFPADARRIMHFLDNLRNTVFSDLVAKNKDDFKQFGLDTPTALTLSAGSTKILELLSGDSRKGGGQYVSFKGDNRVYLLNQTLSAYTSSTYWELKPCLNLKLNK